MNDRAPLEVALDEAGVAKALLAEAWVDRDLGWLEFNSRVLHEATDARTPLLERFKFLGIVTSNLDEFFMKRVSILRGHTVVANRDDPLRQGGQDRAHMAAIRAKVIDMMEQQARCYRDVLLPALAEHGIVLASWDTLTDAQREDASRFFDANVSPALTPLSFDPAHPFPFMSNLSTNWAFVIRIEDAPELRMVRVKIPPELPRWVAINNDKTDAQRLFVGLQDIIRHNASKLLPGVNIVSATLFRILRNAEVELDIDIEDLPTEVADAVRQRRFEPVVRIDFSPQADSTVKRALHDRFELTDDDVYEVPGLIDYTDLLQIAALDRPELRDPPWTPQPAARLEDEDADIFSTIDGGDILVHHPYDSFEGSIERFIESAATDPRTLAIKITVYRVGDDTPFVRWLIRAAEAGKQVACVIELTARFDETRNLHWAQELQKAGAHVTYGVMGLKTHTKVALVVQKHGSALRCYAHIGTGNYHVKTARLYSDVGLLTSAPAITADVVNLFHYLTGYSRGPQYEKLLVAPINMRERFLAMIEREIDHRRAGRPARIIAKLNQFDDVRIGVALSRASAAGVDVDLIVRGFCCLRPGIPQWTEQVRVRSIIGRFLEHSRIFYFANGESEPAGGEFYIGSADWMFRNLSHRVEAIVPIESASLRERLWAILQACLQDERQAWTMQSDGSYIQHKPTDVARGSAAVGTHAWLMDVTRRRLPH